MISVIIGDNWSTYLHERRNTPQWIKVQATSIHPTTTNQRNIGKWEIPKVCAGHACCHQAYRCSTSIPAKRSKSVSLSLTSTTCIKAEKSLNLPREWLFLMSIWMDIHTPNQVKFHIYRPWIFQVWDHGCNTGCL
jgi:hypothetical protein